MKKHISVLGLLARSSVFKVLLILLGMSTVQIVSFHLKLLSGLDMYATAASGMPSLEEMFSSAAIGMYFRVAFVLIAIAVCLPGCEFKSNTSYTLRRLSVSERAVFFHQAVYNMLVYLMLLAVQLVVAFGLARYYIGAAPAECISNQTVVLAFYRNNFLHSILPLEDVGLWIRNGLLVLSLGLASAEFPYRQRRHKFSASTVALGIYTIVCFNQGIGQLTHVISTALITAAVIGEAIYNFTRKEEEAVRYD